MSRDLKNNPVVLTEEQQKLISDNINLVYKFCVTKGIHDEDITQDLITKLCIAVPTFDENKGKFSTFAYTVFNNEWIRRISIMNKESLPEEFTEQRLEWKFRDDEDELSDTIGFDDPELLKLEKVDAFKRALIEYKIKFPFSWKRDLKICYYLANNIIPVNSYYKEFHISQQRARQILEKVSRFFTDFSNGNIQKTNLKYCEDESIFKCGEEKFLVNNDDWYVLLGWVNCRIETNKFCSSNLIGSFDLARIASDELGINVGNADIKKAMFAFNHGSIPEDDGNPNWKYSILSHCPLYDIIKTNYKDIHMKSKRGRK